MADLVIPAYAHGGRLRPLGTVVHSAETPLRAGYAQSIATHWFGTRQAGTSAHTMVDPRDTVRMLPDDVVAYHCGPRGNGHFWGDEQAGYARMSRAEWLSPDGRAQMRRLADVIRTRHQRHRLPLDIITDPAVVRARVAAGKPVGVTYHDTITRALGGTTHTDPMPNYPTDVLQALLYAQAPKEGKTMDFPIFTVFAQAGTTYCANRITREYWGFRNDYQYQAFLNAQARSGIPVDNWGNVGNDFDVAAHFGKRVTQ